MTNVLDRIPDVPLNVRLRHHRGQALVIGYEHTLELSDSAVFIWHVIDGKRTVEDIAGALMGEYGIDSDTSLADTIALIDSLVSHRLLTLT
jgi:hypothetical protein